MDFALLIYFYMLYMLELIFYAAPKASFTFVAEQIVGGSDGWSSRITIVGILLLAASFLMHLAGRLVEKIRGWIYGRVDADLLAIYGHVDSAWRNERPYRPGQGLECVALICRGYSELFLACVQFIGRLVEIISLAVKRGWVGEEGILNFTVPKKTFTSGRHCLYLGTIMFWDIHPWVLYCQMLYFVAVLPIHVGWLLAAEKRGVDVGAEYIKWLG